MANCNESICRNCFHSYVCEQFNENKDIKNNKCHFFNDHFVPTADVVEVVRCKDCKHAYINSFSAQSGVALCKFWSNRAEGNNLVVQQDDYCSYGERRAENESERLPESVEKTR